MQAERPRAADLAYPVVVGGLGLLALVLFAYPAVRAFGLAEVNYNEGWNAFWQLRAVAGLPLYSGQPPLMFNNYPPLSFHLVAALASLTGDVVLAGRLVSLLALGACAGACAVIVRRNGGARTDAGLAAAAFALPLLVFYDSYIGSNDPQLLGLAFALWGLALHLSGTASPRRAAATALLLALAVLTKHNLLAVLLVVTLDTLLRGDWPRRTAFIGTGLAIAAAAAALLWHSDGAAFYAQLFGSREWGIGRAVSLTTEVLLRHQAALALVLAGVWLLRGRPGGVIAALVVAAAGLGAVFSGGAGTAENIWFELIAALAIGAGLVAGRLRALPRGAVLASAAALTAAAAPLIGAPAMLRIELDALRGEMAARDAGFAAEAAFVAAQPGPVLCESLLLCLRADKAPTVDPFNAYQAGLHGTAPKVADLVAQRRFAVVQIRSPRGGEGDRFRNFDPAVYDALDADYRVERSGTMGRFWVPGR